MSGRWWKSEGTGVEGGGRQWQEVSKFWWKDEKTFVAGDEGAVGVGKK